LSGQVVRVQLPAASLAYDRERDEMDSKGTKTYCEEYFGGTKPRREQHRQN